jgi:hypothetical protein
MSRYLLLLACFINCIYVIDGFNTQTVSPLSSRMSLRRPYGCYATTKENEKETTPDMEQDSLVNGDSNHTSDASIIQDLNVSQIMDEISKRINDGSTEIMQNVTNVMDQRFESIQLTETSAKEMSAYIADLANKIQYAQQRELQSQLEELEKKFLQPFEQIAFSDAPLFDIDSQKPKEEVTEIELERQRQKNILFGRNSTISSSARLKTSEIVNNLNVAPLYYSVALLLRYFRKASYPSIWLLSTYKGVANVFKSRSPKWKRNEKGQSYEEYIKDAETMQSGWKRTGEIAAKGSFSKKWAILRRSLEIWAYFSSFYLKDRRIARKYESGKWSEEKFSRERSILGSEITQNLLRLGPTFIKVSQMLCLKSGLYSFFSIASNLFGIRSGNCFRQESTLSRKSILSS